MTATYAVITKQMRQLQQQRDDAIQAAERALELAEWFQHRYHTEAETVRKLRVIVGLDSIRQEAHDQKHPAKFRGGTTGTR